MTFLKCVFLFFGFFFFLPVKPHIGEIGAKECLLVLLDLISHQNSYFSVDQLNNEPSNNSRVMFVYSCRWCFCLFMRHELRAETDLVTIQTAQVLQKSLKSDDRSHFLADLSTARSRAPHDESPLLAAAMKSKSKDEA